MAHTSGGKFNGDSVTFTINGKVYQANSDSVEADTSLNTFIRDHANLKGTKYMCKEGGCGACIVTVGSTHPVTKQETCYAVNSCLKPVLSCHGQAITTIEGIGSKRKGYHKIQSYLAKFNGTQCGYCSPAMVMNMYSLLKTKPQITMKEIENSFGGNICRCTGYRPILDAFKSLASDTTPELKQRSSDIEDLLKNCNLDNGKCKQKCKDCKNKMIEDSDNDDEDNENYEVDFVELALATKKLQLKFTGTAAWYRVTHVYEIFQIFDFLGTNNYKLVAGNTAQGVYREREAPAAFIDINEVGELKDYTIYNDHVQLGANMTLTECINLFRELSIHNHLMFGYTNELADHLELVANVPVRNVGTLAGNLSIKHAHNEFPSDVFLILLTIGAQVVIHDVTGIVDSVPLLQYLDTNMDRKVITRIIIPALSSLHYYLKTYKIMPRKQNVHALVNAGFLFRMNSQQNYYIEEKPVIIFGAISDKFTHAYETETFLNGKPILNQRIVKKAIQTLSEEIQPQFYAVEASPEYRKKLAVSLFYRYVLSVNPGVPAAKYRSGYNNIERPLSSGKQEYVTNQKVWPVTQPVQKIEGQIQCAGEAEYINDKPRTAEDLYGALVLADKANSVISSIDASAALHLPGIVAFYSANDIPGKNSFIVVNAIFPEEEEIFCSGKTLYAGQPVGIVVGVTQELAIKAANYVKINYSSTGKPLLTVEEVLQTGDTSRIILQQQLQPVETKGDIKYVIKGEHRLEGQFHFSMEPQTCLCIPTDNGMTVHSATQWLSNTQNSIAQALNLSSNSINVEVKRLGGAFGCKISRSSMIANACAIAAYKLDKPVRIVLDIETNMRSVGKRYSLLSKYEVAVNDNGVIQYLKLNMYEDYGCALNDTAGYFALEGVKGFYDVSTWTANVYAIKTDNACTAWMRAPGTMEAISTLEYIMDHIAYITKKDPVEVRHLNVNPPDKSVFEEMLGTITKSTGYNERLTLAKKFNSENCWKKKGIALIPMKYAISFFPGYHSTVSIYDGDGSVGITTGGIEMGQGVNTKVAQVAAYTLGIDLNMIKFVPSMSITSPNNFASGGSITSDTVSYATIRACEELMKRLQPIKDQMQNPTWVELIKQASAVGVNLCAQHMYSTSDGVPRNYPVYGFVVTETDVDLLTGQYQLSKVTILEDAGESLSPSIDIGQIEGAFVMGVGYYHSEQLIYNPNDGRLLTDRTWTYWPPGAGDIPVDFRITLRKNAPNPAGVLRSKTTGEPACCLAVSVLHSLRMAIQSAREDNKLPNDWFNFYQPCTYEKVLLTAGTNPVNFSL